MEQDSGVREKLAIVKSAQEALRQQLAEANGVQQRENAARTEEIAGLQRQQEKIAQRLGNLKQQLSSSEGIANVQREQAKSSGATANQSGSKAAPPAPAPKTMAIAHAKPGGQTAGKSQFLLIRDPLAGSFHT
jgi:septal ring factor EnvC (AmiA/AmiB activator)